MRRQLLCIILIVIYSCNTTNTKETVVIDNKDSIKGIPKYVGPHEDYLKHRELALKNIKLDTITNPTDILRFYYNGAFEDYPQFYEINFSNRLLIQKHYTFISPDPSDGRLSGVDSIVSVKTFKLNYDDINTIIVLMDKAMIWSLEKYDSEIRFIADGFDYTYEASRPKETNEPWPEFPYKTYCYVARFNPFNFDFINLGEFLKFKANTENRYKKQFAPVLKQFYPRRWLHHLHPAVFLPQ